MRATGRNNGTAAKPSPKLLGMLNEAIARELQVSIQYIWQHVELSDAEGKATHGQLRFIGIAEMKHAEAIAHRLVCLGGKPDTKPNPVFVGSGLKEMLVRDVEEETGAVQLYRQIIKIASEAKDEATAQLFTCILEEEEDHLAAFTGLLKTI